MRRTVVALAALSACALPDPDHQPHEDAAYEAVAQAWAEAGMPEPADRCRIDLFEVRQVSAGVETVCGMPAERIFACTWMESAGRPMSPTHTPIILISPIWHSEPGVLVHELLHSFAQCTGGGSGHNNPLIWTAAGGADSVQSRATAILVAQGWLDP